MTYRVGFPGWKIAAHAGLRLKLRIDVLHDDEAKVYVATSPDLRGLVAEAKSLDELFANIQAAANDLMQDELSDSWQAPRTELGIRMHSLCTA